MAQPTDDTLASELALLRSVLDEARPGWSEEQLRAVADTSGLIVEPVCLPIRAAIGLICDSHGIASPIHTD